MTDNDAVTRAEHIAAIARLDAADAELRASIVSTERALRTDYEDKISVAVADVKQDIAGVRQALKEDVDGVQDHLTWQDRIIGGALVTGVVTFLVYVALHFLHIHG